MHNFEGTTRFNTSKHLTPWSKVLLEKKIFSQQAKKFPIFHGTQMLIIINTSLYSETNESIYTLQPYFPKVYFNIIIASIPRSSELSPFRPPNQNSVHISHLTHACYMLRPSHPLDLIILIISSTEYKLQSPSLCYFLHLHVTSCYTNMEVSTYIRSCP
jgi:hypothetical protein